MRPKPREMSLKDCARENVGHPIIFPGIFGMPPPQVREYELRYEQTGLSGEILLNSRDPTYLATL